MGRGHPPRLGAALSVVLAMMPVVAGAPPPSLPGGTGGAGDAGEAGPEMRLLDAFYAQFDRVPGVPYCGRVGGGEAWQDAPALPVDRANGTNALFDEHSAWHTRYVRLRAGPDPLDDNVTYGEDFVHMHRFMVAMIDHWRLERGVGATPVWDPATPIPPEFAYALPEACQPRDSEDPRVPLPSWLTVEGGDAPSVLWGYTALCGFPSLNRLAKEVDHESLPWGSRLEPSEALRNNPQPAYHSAVHAGVGGDMELPWWSIRDPVFWAWHKWLDTRFQLWERTCAGREPVVPTAAMAGMRWMGDMVHANAGRDAAASRTTDPPGPAPAPRAVPGMEGLPAVGVLGILGVLASVAASRRR